VVVWALFLGSKIVAEYEKRERMQKITACERTCACVRSASLNIFNVVDFVAGCLLIAGGSYLRTRMGGSVFSDMHFAWLALSTIVLGVMLVIVSMLSFCAVMSPGTWSVM
jgi:hypothetical protein